MFEKHLKAQHGDDDLHVHAISNPEEAAQIAALKLVMNTHLQEKLHLLDTEHKYQAEYLKTIINQKNQQNYLEKIVACQPLLGSHVLALSLQNSSLGRCKI